MASGHELRGAVSVDPHTAMESLTAAGIVMPSLAVDSVYPDLALVDLGRIRADVAVELANALKRGAAA